MPKKATTPKASASANGDNDTPPIADSSGTDSSADAKTLDANEGEASKIAALEAESTELKEKLLRALAEGENIRRRSERDMAQTQKYGHGAFARDVIGVVENLDRALSAMPESPENDHQYDEATKNLITGIKMVAAEMEKTLEKHGLSRINPLGKPFDPNCHQAMLEMETKDAPPASVIQVTQTGWMLHDRLLRPAMVAVAKAPIADKGENKANSAKNEANFSNDKVKNNSSAKN